MKSTGKGPATIRKRRPARGRDGIIVGLGFGLLGLLFLFIVVPQVAKDFVVSRTGLVDNKADFDAVPIGDDVVVYGELDGNPSIEGEAVVIVQEELVRTQGGNDADWDWEETRRDIPLLILVMQGGSVVLTTDSGPVNLRGERHEVLDAVAGDNLADTYPYQDQRIAEGSTRTFTLKNGDRVTALGMKAGDNELAIRELFGGSPDQLTAELGKGATVFTLAAWCFLGFSGFAIGVGIIAALRGKF